jgi:hypothetical protein
MCISEVVLWELENDGNEDKELPGDLLPNIAMELCDFIIVLFHNLMSGLVCIRWDGFGNVELQVISKIT